MLQKKQGDPVPLLLELHKEGSGFLTGRGVVVKVVTLMPSGLLWMDLILDE